MERNRTLVYVLTLILSFAGMVHSQATAFTYQGKLQVSGTPANGSYDLEFRLFPTEAGGTQVGDTLVRAGVPVVNGIFNVTLDFGDQFPGTARFLQLGIRPVGESEYTALDPRQPITSTPYAVKSLNAEAAETAFTLSCTNCVTSGQIASLDGSKVTNIPGGNIIPGSISSAQMSVDVRTDNSPSLVGQMRWDILRQQRKETDQAFDLSSVCTTPSAMTSDGTAIWVACSGNGRVLKLNRDSGAVLRNLNIGSNPSSLAFDGSFIWVAVPGANRVYKLSANDGGLAAIFSGILFNGSRLLAFDGQFIWVVVSSGNMRRIDVFTGSLVGSADTMCGTNDSERISSLTVTGTHMWVGCKDFNSGLYRQANLDGTVTATTVTFPKQDLFPNLRYLMLFDGNCLWAQPDDFSVQGVNANCVGSSLVPSSNSFLTAMVFDGTYIWAASSRPVNSSFHIVRKLRRTEVSLGVVRDAFAGVGIEEVGSTIGEVRSLIFDGRNVWAADSTGNQVIRYASTWPKP